MIGGHGVGGACSHNKAFGQGRIEPARYVLGLGYPIPHIKENSVLKAYWADMQARENTAMTGSEGSSGCHGPKNGKILTTLCYNLSHH